MRVSGQSAVAHCLLAEAAEDPLCVAQGTPHPPLVITVTVYRPLYSTHVYSSCNTGSIQIKFTIQLELQSQRH